MVSFACLISSAIIVYGDQVWGHRQWRRALRHGGAQVGAEQARWLREAVGRADTAEKPPQRGPGVSVHAHRSLTAIYTRVSRLDRQEFSHARIDEDLTAQPARDLGLSRSSTRCPAPVLRSFPRLSSRRRDHGRSER